MDAHPLDNPAWNALTGPHAAFAVGAGGARRYGPGFASIAGFSDLGQPDLAALLPWSAPGDQFSCQGVDPQALAPHWSLEGEIALHQMLWHGPEPTVEADLPDLTELGSADWPAMRALVDLTQPGPFGERSLDLGRFVGVVREGHLLAMAGERMAVDEFVEISAVCTHPEHRGRGLASALVLALVRRLAAEGKRPFLHVVAANEGAVRVYQRLGFAVRNTVTLQIVKRT